MTRLATFTDSEQLSLDDVMAEFRDASPPGAAREGRKEPSVATAGADPDVIMADLEALGDVSRVKIGTEPHLNGDCPYAEQCDERRRKLSTYREHQPCHWISFWNVAGCPIFKNGGAT